MDELEKIGIVSPFLFCLYLREKVKFCNSAALIQAAHGLWREMGS